MQKENISGHVGLKERIVLPESVASDEEPEFDYDIRKTLKELDKFDKRRNINADSDSD